MRQKLVAQRLPEFTHTKLAFSFLSSPICYSDSLPTSQIKPMSTNKKWGLRRLLQARLMRMLHRLIGLRLNAIYVGADRPDVMDPEKLGLADGYEARMCSREDLLPHACDAKLLSEEFLHSEMADDDDCAAAFHNGELVAYMFMTRRRVRLTDQLDALVPDGFRTAYKGWTHRDHRRMNLSNHMSYLANMSCWDRDFSERSVWYIETTNYASRLHGHLTPNMWSVRMGYFGWISLFGKEFPFNSRWAKRIGFIALRKTDPGIRCYEN